MAGNSAAIAATNGLETYMKQIRSFPILSREEENKTAIRMRDEADALAKEKLVTSNLRFVVQVANEFRRKDRSLLDLIQEGNLGLLHAVQKFDPDRGYRLITYAVWWIRAYIQTYVIRTFSLVKLGTTQAQRRIFFRLSAAEAKLQQDTKGQVYSSADRHERLAEYLGVRPKDVSMMEMRQAGRDFSLDAALQEGSSTSSIDLLADDVSGDTETLVVSRNIQNILRPVLSDALDTLRPREREIAKERMLREDPPTLREMGERFGVSRERARQIESRAREKLKDYLLREVPELDVMLGDVLEANPSSAAPSMKGP
jgi:RNA polymerase sigma-32 factor